MAEDDGLSRALVLVIDIGPIFGCARGHVSSLHSEHRPWIRRGGPSMSRGLALAAGLLVPCAALAQSFVIPVPAPKNIILPNYDNVLIGPVEAVEAGAYLARTQDASASFYNPAGLA